MDEELKDLIKEVKEITEMIESDMSVTKGMFAMDNQTKEYARNIKNDLWEIINKYEIAKEEIKE